MGHGSRTTPHLNAEFGPCRGDAMPQGAALDAIGSMFAIWQSAQAAPRQAQSRHHEYAFAALLLIKQLVGLRRLGKLPAVGEQVLDRNFSIGDEACAFGLPDL